MNETTKIPDLPAIGANLHKARRKQQLSLAELAAASGISKAMLSQIESEKVNPTIATLWKIAHALHIELEALLTGETADSGRFEVLRKEDVPALSTDRSGAVFHVLTPVSMSDELELYRVTLSPRCIHRSLPHAKGTEEFHSVLKGEVKYTVGDRTATLKEGDFVRYRADGEHVVENLTGDTAEVFMVIRFQPKGW